MAAPPIQAPGNGGGGIPVDRYGGGTIDPTQNVLQLVEAAGKRQDDLRDAESRHIRELMKMTGDYEDKLATAEANRINAIRAVDVAAVAVAAERAAQQAGVLANQVSTSAETLRTLVASTSTALAEQLTQIITPITARIAVLERAQYEGAGKAGVTDPQMAQLVSEMRATREVIAIGAGAKQGGQETKVEGRDQTRLVLAIVAGLVGFLGFLMGVAGFAYAVTR